MSQTFLKKKEEELKIEGLEAINEVKKEEQTEVISEVKKEEGPEVINEVKKEEQTEVINEVKKKEEPEVINEVKKEEGSEVINEIKKKEVPEVINEVKKKEEPEVINEIKKKEEPEVINDVKKKEDKPFNKKIYQTIASSLPRRTKTNLKSFKNIIRSKTKDLSEKEKSYVIFIWECNNINYDLESLLEGRYVDCTPEGAFTNGKTICSGYSSLYKDIASHIGLNVLCISGYAKGIGYYPGKKLTYANHEYNVIKIDGNWHVIDCTWGSSHIKGKLNIKIFNEFYFLANPELLIKTHFPAEKKWQLTEKRYTLVEFLKWPKVSSYFYICGFSKYFPEVAVLNLKNVNTQKFIIWGDNIKNIEVFCHVSFMKGDNYIDQSGLSLVSPYEDRFEIDCRFNKKGTYIVQIFGKKDERQNYCGEMIKYKVNVKNDAKKKLKFPHTFIGAHAIKLIEPLYNGLKSGEIIKFKMESDLDNIVIIDIVWHYLERNEEGFFEKEIEIQSKPGKNITIGINEPKSVLSLIKYDII